MLKILKMNAIEKYCWVERIKLVVNTNTIHTYKFTNLNVAYPVLHTPLLSSRHSEALFCVGKGN